MAEDKIPILLDTDPGSDIDDALAIAYLLCQPRCELLGITTVTGDVVKRAAIVDMICREYGRTDIPIRCGISDTLSHGPGQPLVPHFEAIAEKNPRLDFFHDAVDFLRETIRSRPHEITLLSIGPFTNVATLFALDPEIPSLLKGFVSMAGHFFGDYAEWNCRCDPAATVAVVKRAARQTLIGLDVTLKCTMDSNQVKEAFSEKPHDVLLPMTDKWFKSADRITFHDPLAAAIIFEPQLCIYQCGTVECPDYEGTTAFKEGRSNACVAIHVEHEAFFKHYLEVLSNVG